MDWMSRKRKGIKERLVARIESSHVNGRGPVARVTRGSVSPALPRRVSHADVTELDGGLLANGTKAPEGAACPRVRSSSSLSLRSLFHQVLSLSHPLLLLPLSFVRLASFRLQEAKARRFSCADEERTGPSPLWLRRAA